MSSTPPKESPSDSPATPSDSSSSPSPPSDSSSSPSPAAPSKDTPTPPTPNKDDNKENKDSPSPPAANKDNNKDPPSPPAANKDNNKDSPSPPAANKDNNKDNKDSPSSNKDDSKDNKDSPSSNKDNSKDNKDSASGKKPGGDDNDNGDDNSGGNNDNNNKSPPKSGSSSPASRREPPTQSSRSGSSSRNNANALSSSSSQRSNAKQKAIIIGVTAAAAGFVLLLCIFILLCCRRCFRRKKRKVDSTDYYRDNSYGNKSTDYFNNAPQGNWQNNNNNNRPSVDHMVKMPPTFDSGAVSSEYGWQAKPPPPPPMMNSTEMSSAGFSGPAHAPSPPPHPAIALGGFSQSSFSYDDLAAATNGFSKANLLGQGGFGYVHKGVLPNGKEIAVKSLKANSGQGEREFQAEVEIISRVHHRHLVSLVGYCIAGAQRMLVYEFVPNGTLEYHLHGAGRPTMDWPTRLKIALGAAKGFAYLHEDCHPRIIHRDIKAANILIDLSFEAKVADFGLAKLSSDNNTHVSTRIMGTFGYLAPEYASSGKLTDKSDVYSYGIMLLELISGRRPVDLSTDDDYDTLVDWARPILIEVAEGGSYERLVDPRLEDNYDHDEMLRLVHCAAASIRHSARRRPKMSQIVRALEGDVSLDHLHDGSKPASAMLGSSSMSEYKFKKAGVTSSQEFTSSEHGLTGEFARSIDGSSHESGESNPSRSNRNRNL